MNNEECNDSVNVGNGDDGSNINDGTKMSAARRKVLADNMQENLEAAGFKRLDPKVIDNDPPRIKWGELYKQFTDAEKIEYLEKLASTMNHAAYLIQGERDEVLTLCGLKEQQLEKLSSSMGKNDSMVQSEIMKMNEERQSFNKHVAELNKKIRELEAAQ
jgi:hypothetical protein